MNERDELREAFAADGAADVDELMDVANLLWEADHGAPPLDEDPVALMLGLVSTPTMSLDKAALKRLRMNARVSVADLAKQLAARGWEVTAQQTFRWETQGASDLSPALLTAIADVLGSKIDGLVVSGGVENRPGWLEKVTQSDAYSDIVSRWAKLKKISVQLASVSLESKLLATVHRGGRPEDAQLLETLSAFVEAVENREKR